MDKPFKHAGKRFGNLTILSKGEYRSSIVSGRKKGYFCWKVACDCGTIKDIMPINIKNGETVSCGCYAKSKQKGSAAREFYAIYKRNAKARNIDFSINYEEFNSLTKMDCNYCGEPPKLRKPIGSEDLIANGIDRKDNGAGYTSENSVPCCSVCNMMKKSLGAECFIDHIRKIYEFSISKDAIDKLLKRC